MQRRRAVFFNKGLPSENIGLFRQYGSDCHIRSGSRCLVPVRRRWVRAMSTGLSKSKILLLVVGFGWCAFWFWAFSFAYSSGFFRYNMHSRLPTFIAALFAACALPASALLQWRQVKGGRRGRLAGMVIHVVASCAVLAVPFATMFILSRAPSPWRLEADDAMGVGIDIALLVLVAGGSAAVLGVALLVRATAKRSDDSLGNV
jgi:hypothetical protein